MAADTTESTRATRARILREIREVTDEQLGRRRRWADEAKDEPVDLGSPAVPSSPVMVSAGRGTGWEAGVTIARVFQFLEFNEGNIDHRVVNVTFIEYRPYDLLRD